MAEQGGQPVSSRTSSTLDPTPRPRGSRDRILEASRQVFFRDGFMAANLDEVARRAGVAKGTLYRYFDSKADLYVAVLANKGDEFERRMRATVDPSQSSADQIRATARFYFDHWTQNREYFQIFWAIENQSVIGELPPAVVDHVSHLWEECLQILADVVREGVSRREFVDCDAWEIANIFWTLGNAVIATEATVTRRNLRRKPLDETFRDSVEVLLRGLAASSSAS
jgi:TetR/AcrR family fatty acid metabolism transcriptional regulator